MVKLAIIPARRGSKRLPGKNMALLNGKPLVQIAIEEAQKSGCFDQIVVSSDDEKALGLALRLGVIPHLRPDELCRDESHDYEFVRDAVSVFPCDIFAILRPTSPFRTADTIKRAVTRFIEGHADSIRAVEKVKQHPRKMWCMLRDGYMRPHMPQWGNPPKFDLPTQAFEPLYVQNGCIHIAWSRVLSRGNVSGQKIMPFFTVWPEGIDINEGEDLNYAEYISAVLHGSGDEGAKVEV